MEPNELPPVRGYTGWAFPPEERDHLLAIIAPIFPDVVAHHITDHFNVRSTADLPTATQGLIVGVGKSDTVQALVVEIGGSTLREDGEHYHITWSLDRASGAKPKDSKDVVRDYARLETAIPLTLIPTFFPFNPVTAATVPVEEKIEPKIEDEPFSESTMFKSLLSGMRIWI